MRRVRRRPATRQDESRARREALRVPGSGGHRDQARRRPSMPREGSRHCREWFRTADFFCSLVRRAIRSPANRLVRRTARGRNQVVHPAGLAAPGSRIERLDVEERQKVLGAVGRLMRLQQDDVEGSTCRVPESAGKPGAGSEPVVPDTLVPDRLSPAGPRAAAPSPTAEAPCRTASAPRSPSDDEAPRAEPRTGRAMTNAAPAASTTCDECRRHGVRIARIHRGERFCQTCYERMFKRRLCPKCGNFARLPRLEPDAVCLKCENARPCVRCGRIRYRTGMRTAYGPACIACAAYFKPPQPCEACGTPSRWLSRESELGDERRRCPRCRRRGHETCEACRRHRRLSVPPRGDCAEPAGNRARSRALGASSRCRLGAGSSAGAVTGHDSPNGGSRSTRPDSPLPLW